MGLKSLLGTEVAATLAERIPGSVAESDQNCVVVAKTAIPEVMRLLKESPEFDFNYLNNITSVDYLGYFEVIYNLTSFKNRHTLTVKTRVSTRENPEVPSVTHLWKGADFQEREIYDLMGIGFPGHPNLKRIALWEGFEGHPLRKDFL